MDLAVGLVLVLLGAFGASATARTLDERGRGRAVPVAVAPMGVLVGAGAALVRGWDPVGSMVSGAVLLPLVAAVVRLLEARRRRRHEGSP